MQIAGGAETSPINMDTLLIGQYRVPGGGRSGVLESERGEVELTLANAMYQLDA